MLKGVKEWVAFGIEKSKGRINVLKYDLDVRVKFTNEYGKIL